MSGDDELVRVFLEESRENLAQLDLDLVELESVPNDAELLARVFRTMHTIKGTCGFLGYERLEALAHAGEDLLAAVRSGALPLSAEVTSSLLGLVDEVRAVLDVVEATGQEADDDHAQVIADLRAHLGSPVTPNAEPPTHDAREPTSTGSVAPERDAGPAPVAAQPALGHEDVSVRVDVTVLDTLQDLIGELTLARIRIGDSVTETESFAQPFHDLTLVTRELRDTVMLARLQPVGTVISTFRRVVRDLARGQDKQVRVDVSGEDVGVDKAINEVLRDPLMHLVRNAVDHGIESPGDRVLAGKPSEARLRIEASLTGGRVQIDVADDGRGIDTDRLVERACATGHLTSEEAAALDEEERLALVFLPGLSTNEETTTLSGRGVGMDAVKSGIERVGGSVDVTSHVGAGSLVRINVPLTLAIIHAVIVRCGDGRFAIPEVDIEAIARVEPDDMVHRIDDVEGVRFLRRRGHLLPLVDLAATLGVQAAPRMEGLEIVIIRSLDRAYGLIVDHVADNVEVVVKPLPPAIRGTSSFAGVTMLASGRPALILDVAALAHHVAATRPPTGLAEEQESAPSDGAQLIVVTSESGERWALPLEGVNRLEQFRADQVEHSGSVEVIQHRGAVMPLLRVGRYLDELPTSEPVRDGGSGDALDVVVCATSIGLVGFVVAAIEEILPRPVVEPEHVGRVGVVGRMVVDERVTDLLDIEALLALAGFMGPT